MLALFILLIIIVSFFYLAVTNSMDVDFLFFGKVISTELSILMGCSFLLGAVLVIIGWLVRYVKRAFEGYQESRQKKKGELLKEELNKGIEDFIKGNLTKAKAHFTEVLKKDPSQIDLYFRLSDISIKEGNEDEALNWLERARLIDIRNIDILLREAGLYQRMKRYDEAIVCWEKSCGLDANFSIPWRNLGIAYYNVRHEPARAMEAYRCAFGANPMDARLLYEWDQLKKRIGQEPQERLAYLESRLELVNRRDDLTLERATLYNQLGQPQKSLEILLARRFHPWEGGEGLVSGQYDWAHWVLGVESLESGKPDQALRHFAAARKYPETLGEGKHLLTPENHLDFYEGLAHAASGDKNAARLAFHAAAQVRGGYSAMTFYQGMALAELGECTVASERFRALLDFARHQLNVEARVDYFATSLPNFLLFEDDLQKRHRVECLYLIGLAWRGLNEFHEAEKSFHEVLKLEINHLGAGHQLKRLPSIVKSPALRRI